VPQEACSDYQCEREKDEKKVNDPDIVEEALKPIALLALSFGLAFGGSAATYLGLRARDAGRLWSGRCLLALGVVLAAAGPLSLLLGWPMLRAGRL